MSHQKYFIRTYGCQMNTADSERIAASFERQGFKPVEVTEEADFIILNSCVVRQAAEDSIYGFGRKAEELKQKNKNLKIIITGCLVGGAEDRGQRIDKDILRKKLPWVDEFWPVGKIGFEIFPKRINKNDILIPISSGCNNFCTYCVVPYTRGKEKSRQFDGIINEITKLAFEGVTEVTLLGQNVNSYGKDLEPPRSFAEVLRSVHAIEGVKQIKFLTAHPKDMSDELINTIAELPKVDRYLHFPLQAGDDGILKRMNRGYTSSDYEKLVSKIRKKIPGVRIGTDIIVGFPGETEEQFEQTVRVCRNIRFENAFVAMYSPRKGTAAYNFTDDVPAVEKHRRHKILLDLFKEIKSKD